MKEIILRTISLVLIPLVLSILSFNAIKKQEKSFIKNLREEHIIIRRPSFFWWIGCIGVLVFSSFILMVALHPNETATWFLYLFFSIFLLTCFVIINEYLAYKIDIYRSKDFFIYRTFFFKKIKILYTECISYIIKPGGSLGGSLVLKTKYGKIDIWEISENYEFILEMLRKHKIKKEIKQRKK